jgi:3-oxoacyl-[acyl-carrier protein] reductase
MDLLLSWKNALVTGASAGLGRTIALLLAQEGCRLAIVARREPLLQGLADDIHARGGERPQVIVCDITRHDAPARIRAQLNEGFGVPDILVNNAGGSGHSMAWDRGRSGMTRWSSTSMPVANSPMRSCRTCKHAASGA